MLSVNFVSPDHNKSARRKTIVLAGLFTIAVGFIATAGANASYRSVRHGTSILSEFSSLPVISDMRRIMFGDDGISSGLATKKDDNLLNILILGIGGAGHNGSTLTDTIIFMSADLKEKRLGMVSVPRDLAYPISEGRYEKINAVHVYAEKSHPGEGAIYTAEEMSAFFDVPIDHVIRIDFKGFKAFIDALGGIDVDVERGFTDVSFPTYDDLYQTVSFKAGKQHMDGSRALQLVRSRHGNNGEGSDFARSSRQQLVLVAVREKLLSLKTLSDPRKLANLYKTVTSNIQSDLNAWDLIKLAPLAEDFDPSNIARHTLTNGPEGLLTDTHINGSYLLFPVHNDWNPIKSLIQNPFLTKEEFKEETAPSLAVAKIEIHNGTFQTGLAGSVSSQLELLGYETMAVGNAGRRDYETTVIYDLTNGQKSDQLIELKRLLDADVSLSSAVSDGNFQVVFGRELSKERIVSTDIDFFIILGDKRDTLSRQES